MFVIFFDVRLSESLRVFVSCLFGIRCRVVSVRVRGRVRCMSLIFYFIRGEIELV